MAAIQYPDTDTNTRLTSTSACSLLQLSAEIHQLAAFHSSLSQSHFHNRQLPSSVFVSLAKPKLTRYDYISHHSEDKGDQKGMVWLLEAGLISLRNSTTFHQHRQEHVQLFSQDYIQAVGTTRMFASLTNTLH